MAVTAPTTSVPELAAAPRVRPWLGWFALAVIIGMQAGTVFRPLGDVGETRVADWVDLLTPYAVLGTAAVVLFRAGATPSQWGLFGFGGVTFALGKGLHLAANSVSNVADPVVAGAPVVHLWDEVVSHLIWFSGLFVVLAGDRLGPARHPVPGRPGGPRGRRTGGGDAHQQLHRGRPAGARPALPRRPSFVVGLATAPGPRVAAGARRRAAWAWCCSSAGAPTGSSSTGRSSPSSASWADRIVEAGATRPPRPRSGSSSASSGTSRGPRGAAHGGCRTGSARTR